MTMQLPRSVSAAFVRNCRAYHDASSDIERKAIAFDQLERLRAAFDPNTSLHDVLDAFERAPASLGIAVRRRK